MHYSQIISIVITSFCDIRRNRTAVILQQKKHKFSTIPNRCSPLHTEVLPCPKQHRTASNRSFHLPNGASSVSQTKVLHHINQKFSPAANKNFELSNKSRPKQKLLSTSNKCSSLPQTIIITCPKQKFTTAPHRSPPPF